LDAVAGWETVAVDVGKNEVVIRIKRSKHRGRELALIQGSLEGGDPNAEAESIGALLNHDHPRDVITTHR
jgi:hypothetical protein